MAVSITFKGIINVTSNGTSFKKLDKDGKFYIYCYINDIFRFKLEYTDEITRNSEFNQIIDNVYDKKINLDTDYTGTVIEVE